MSAQVFLKRLVLVCILRYVFQTKPFTEVYYLLILFLVCYNPIIHVGLLVRHHYCEVRLIILL